MNKKEAIYVKLMRNAIATLGTPESGAYFRRAQDYFQVNLMDWTDQFCALERDIYMIWCSYTPAPTGKYHNTSIEIGYSAFPISTWKNDKVQPTRPEKEELLARIDTLMALYRKGQ